MCGSYLPHTVSLWIDDGIERSCMKAGYATTEKQSTGEIPRACEECKQGVFLAADAYFCAQPVASLYLYSNITVSLFFSSWCTAPRRVTPPGALCILPAEPRDC